MTFALQQLVEKSLKHQTKQFIVFVDMRKAYDLVLHVALWRVLEKLDVPNGMIRLVQSFHDTMKAQVSINGELLEENIEVGNVSIDLH